MILDISEKADALLEEILVLTKNGNIRWEYRPEDEKNYYYQGVYSKDHMGWDVKLTLINNLFLQLESQATMDHITITLDAPGAFEHFYPKRVKLAKSLLEILEKLKR